MTDHQLPSEATVGRYSWAVGSYGAARAEESRCLSACRVGGGRQALGSQATSARALVAPARFDVSPTRGHYRIRQLEGLRLVLARHRALGQEDRPPQLGQLSAIDRDCRASMAGDDSGGQEGRRRPAGRLGGGRPTPWSPACSARPLVPGQRPHLSRTCRPHRRAEGRHLHLVLAGRAALGPPRRYAAAGFERRLNRNPLRNGHRRTDHGAVSAGQVR